MVEAHRAEAAVIAGDELGPLHCVPFGIKDLNATKGIRTTYGSLLFGDNVPQNDDIVSERIRASGAIIVGKTNTPDFGWKGTTESTIAGPCVNPWDTTRTSGGSSGGSGGARGAARSALQWRRRGRLHPHPREFLRRVRHQARRMTRAQRLHRRHELGRTFAERPHVTNVRDSALLLSILAGPDARDPRSLGQPEQDYLAAIEAPSVEGMRIAWGGAMDDQPIDPQVLALAQAARRPSRNWAQASRRTCLPSRRTTPSGRS